MARRGRSRVAARSRGQIVLRPDYRNFEKRLRATDEQLSKVFSEPGAVNDILTRLQRRQENRWIRNFDSQGGEYEPWAEVISDVTIDKGPGKNTLVDSGASRGMLPSFQTENAERGRAGWLSIDWDFTGKGSTDFPLPFHHTGYVTPYPWGNTNIIKRNKGSSKDKGIEINGVEVVARPIWELDKKDDDNAYRSFSRWAHDRIREIFG